MAESPPVTPRSKLFKGKRCLPSIPYDLRRHCKHDKFQLSPGIKFDMETSMRGKQSTGQIKQMSVSLSYNNADNTCANTSGVEIPSEDSECGKSSSENNSDNAQGFPGICSELTQVIEADGDKENILTHVQGFVDFRTSVDQLDLNGLGSASIRTPKRNYTLDEKLLMMPGCYSSVQIDLPRYELRFDKAEQHPNGEDSSSVTVAVRVRPYSQRELCDAYVRCVVGMNGNETTVISDNGSIHRFTYDFSFWSFDDLHGKFSNQEHVYLMLAEPLLSKAFQGYNTCLFAYGQTGSGKSYSIMGHGKEIGIIPRFCEELFSRAEVTRDSDKGKLGPPVDANTDRSLPESMLVSSTIAHLQSLRNGKSASVEDLPVGEVPPSATSCLSVSHIGGFHPTNYATHNNYLAANPLHLEDQFDRLGSRPGVDAVLLEGQDRVKTERLLRLAVHTLSYADLQASVLFEAAPLPPSQDKETYIKSLSESLNQSHMDGVALVLGALTNMVVSRRKSILKPVSKEVLHDSLRESLVGSTTAGLHLFRGSLPSVLRK